MSIIVAYDDRLVFEYTNSQGGVFWIHERLNADQDAPLHGRIFRFRRSDALTPITPDIRELEEEFDFRFLLGEAVDGYFRIEGRKLGIGHDVYIATDFELAIRHFVVSRRTSVFRILADLVESDIYVGGHQENAIPSDVFGQLLDAMPTETELRKYVLSRASGVLRNYVDQAKDAEGEYQKYRNRREAISTEHRAGARLSIVLRSHEVAKHESILDRLREMLLREVEYSEDSWQREIADILTLLYPKYIAALREGPIMKDGASSDLSVDFVLVDSEGHVDLLEIKKPSGQQVITKEPYRGNYIPMRSLTGCVMQLEKYIYHLMRSGSKGESKMMKKFAPQLPTDLKIRVTNPQGFILMGRDSDLSGAQRRDFEVVRRQYKNIIDILTYDDLIRRVEWVIAQLTRESVSLLGGN